MRSSQQAQPTRSSSPTPRCLRDRELPRRPLRARRTIALCALALAFALLPACVAHADWMSLSIAPAPVEELTSQITYSAWSEEGTFTVLAVNNPGVPCADSPQGDAGQVLSGLHFLEPGEAGDRGGSVNWTPPSTGAYTVCGWLTIPAGVMQTEGGPVVAAAALPIEVRAPRISLRLRFPRRVSRGRPFALELLANSEVRQEVTVVRVPLTRRGCPVDPAASSTAPLIQKEITGGPWLVQRIVRPLAAGRWIFCAWAEAIGNAGLHPQASAALRLDLRARGGSQGRHAAARRPATHGEFTAIDRYFAATERSLHVRLDWVRVSGPYALAYLSGDHSVSVNVLRGAGRRWRNLATVSDEGLPCGLVAAGSVRALGVERYNEGPKPCSR